MRFLLQLFPLDYQRYFQPVVIYRSFFSDQHFYRQIYRQSHLILENSFQHLSGCIENNRRSRAGHLSRCIEIYRFPRCSLATSMRPSAGRNGAKKVSASNHLTYCLSILIRQFFYRHDAVLKASASRKTTEMAAIKCLN